MPMRINNKNNYNVNYVSSKKVCVIIQDEITRWPCCSPAGCGSWLVEALSDSGSAGSDSAAAETGSVTTGTATIKAKR